MIRLMIAALVLGVSQASAETVISYDDGSTYTLKRGEEIYISASHHEVFKRREYSNGNQYFIVQIPWPQRDYVSQPTDGLEMGSHDWCQAFVPWSEGFTFNQQAWDRYCDTNNDGVYGPGDSPWEG